MTRWPHRRHVALHNHHQNHDRQITPDLADVAEPVPEIAVEPESLGTPTLEGRSPLYTHHADPGEVDVPKPSCSGSASQCDLPTSSRDTTTLPIVLGVVIPITVAAVILIFLHRRLVKKRRVEDNNDKYRSLDFGLGEGQTFGGKKLGIKGKKGGQPEMSNANLDHMIRHGRGVSIEIDSPYVLPDESRPSFHSSHDDGDPYRPVTMLNRSGSNSPNLRPTTSGKDSSTSDNYLSPSNTFASSASLIPNAQRSPLSSPITKEGGKFLDSPPILEVPPPVAQKSGVVTRKPVAPPQPVELPDSTPAAVELPPAEPTTHSRSAESSRTPSSSSQARESRASTGQTSQDSLPTRGDSKAPRIASLNTKIVVEAPEEDEEELTYADVLGIVQKETMSPEMGGEDFFGLPVINEPDHSSAGLGVQNVSFDDRRLSASIRPLPPDHPDDTAEQRANRIRSFYKEYFQGDGNDEEYDQYDYYEDYGQEYLGGATIWDPETGQFIVAERPFAAPVTRRAMTPPPRAPPRFRGGPRPGHGSGGSMPGPGGSRFRAYSSASGRPGPRGRPKKKLPPPKDLTTLPTPHMLKSDAALMSAVDFAPPQSFKDRAAGSRPDSPFGAKKPYSPGVRAHTPLASPFTDLAAMPSPHHLRKSGTFTALDFAPPPRFKNQDTASDGGSIRSGGSNISRLQLHNIRNGAYRVSRLPAETVGTRDDLASSLRPTWQQRA